MASQISWRDVLSPDLVRQVEDEINRQFADGWNACKSAIMTLEPTEAGRSAPAFGSAILASDDERDYPAERAPRGFWSGLVAEEARERSPDGLPLRDAMAAVQARTDQFRLARSSLNVAISTLEKEGRLRREGKTLFWVPSASSAPEAEAAPSEQSEAEDDDERSASAISPLFRRLDDAAA